MRSEPDRRRRIRSAIGARILDGQQRGGSGEENRLAFERLPYVALLKTYNTNQQVPDSAGTATAMLTGVKTRAGVLNLDASALLGEVSRPDQRLRTLFEAAEARGLATGIVSTARLTHATPAAAYAHSPHRDWECDADLPAEAAAAGERDIARQLVELAAGDGIDVALGGGRAQFLPASATDPEYPRVRGRRADGRDLAAAWQSARPGRAFVWSRGQLAALDLRATRQILGLFEPSYMRFEAERAQDPAGEPSLAEMTATAIDRLARHDAGYVLLVEGGRTDHGHHASSAFHALHDAIALSEAVETALRRVDLAETLVVVTADHGHALTIAGYPTRGNPILGLVHSNDERGEPTGRPERDASGLPFTTLHDAGLCERSRLHRRLRQPARGHEAVPALSARDARNHEGPARPVPRRHHRSRLPAGEHRAARIRDAQRRGRRALRRRPRRPPVSRRAGAELRLPRARGGARLVSGARE